MTHSDVLRREHVGYPEPLSVGNEFYRAVLIGAMNIGIAQPVGQSLQHLRAGMTKADLCVDKIQSAYALNGHLHPLFNGNITSKVGQCLYVASNGFLYIG